LRRIGLQAGVESGTLSFTMGKHADKGVIGFCSMVSQEIANRRMGGVLHYLQDTPGLSLRDFRLFGDCETDLIRFLRKAPKPLGVFAMNDHHARAVCMLCNKLGLDVPNEVAVLGSGNLIASRSSSPTLSSVETRNDEIGYEAMKLLHHLVRGGRAPRRLKMIPPIRVIERESSCPGFTNFGDAIRAREYIREHACEGIRVADVVRALSISRRTLEYHFRQSVGHSPGEEIDLVRLARAKDLLTGTDLSMTAVSGMAGFGEPPRFSEFFRRQVGLTPSEYRQRWKEGVGT